MRDYEAVFMIGGTSLMLAVVVLLLFGCARHEPIGANTDAPAASSDENSHDKQGRVAEPSSVQMPNRLHVKLLDGWSDHSKDHPDGPAATFLRDPIATSGALQVSTAEFREGEPPDLSEDKLSALVRSTAARSGYSEVIETNRGVCSFGHWVMARFRSKEVAHAQFWCLSNGRALIFATYISEATPDPTELDEAATIVMSMELVESK